jgi:hypothetical protein
MTLEKLIKLCERISRLHSGRDLREVMTSPDCDQERGMLHMVLDTLDHCQPLGYEAVARALAKDGHHCHGSVGAAWANGLHFYAHNGMFKMQYHQIVHKLTHGRAAR